MFGTQVGGNFAALNLLEDMDTLINSTNEVVRSKTGEKILVRERRKKKPLVTDEILDLCDRRREPKDQRNDSDIARLYQEANRKVKKMKEADEK